MSDSFSREELLGGLPGRRASMLLFAIENRTAQLVEQDVRDAAVYMTFASSQAREQDFFAALARGRTAAAVTIQQLERYAPQWKWLLPENPDPKLNAALAQLLGTKYKFTRAETPNLRAALRIKEEPTQQAFQTGYGKAIDTIFAPQLDLAARIRFGWARLASLLEGLPPFWMAFLLTMPGAAGLLALPVALARVGVGGGLLLLLVFALLNMFTVAALAEATARSGVTRYGFGWLGQLVQEYLGSAGSLFLTIILALNNFFVLIIFYLAVGGTLEAATRVPALLWIVVLFAICLFFLSRGSLNATIASTLILVLISIFLLVLIPMLALPYFQMSNLSATPFVSLEFGSVQLAIGVLLATLFSHLLVATYGPVVLRKDASARTWIWGSAAAIFGFFLIASVWLVVINGVVPSEILVNAPGTVLPPLAEIAGPTILWLGSLLVILSLGLASVQIALGLYYLVQERLPAEEKPSLLSNPRLRFLVSILPIAAVFVLAEWLAFTGEGSFAGFLGILGAFALPLLSGVFPVLLLASTRHKGEFVPGVRSHWLGNRILLTVVYLFFVGIIFLYGLVIFQQPLTRLLMIGVGLVTLAVTFVMLRRGALAPRLVIRFLQDQRHAHMSNYALVENGNPARAHLNLEYDAGVQRMDSSSGEFSWDHLRAVHVRMTRPTARQLKIWALRYTPEGELQPKNVQVVIQTGAHRQELESSPGRADVVVPLEQGALDARLKFD